ncbi:S41 family peptidase [Massilia aerilata]|uniref:S41 family peptidase n=1 Tax=Massilia aerilata TaxID=453817 RepID=A0ABW0RYW0_9BURK
MLAARLRREFSDPYRLAKGIAFLAIAYLTLAVILPSTLATWQEAHTAGRLDVTPAMRAELVESLADKVSRRYLDAAKAAGVAAALRQAERDKEYDGISSPGQFARLLTSELQRLSDDRHMQVIFAPEGVPVLEERNFPPPYKDEQPLPAWLVDRLGRYMAKFGVEEATQSEAGIAYLRIDGFERPHRSAEKFAAAMDRLAGSRALIIDLRNNSGGNRDGVALLASYFFDQPTHLSDVVAPRSGERLQMWTRGKVEGAHYGSARPVYILTSHATFSAGEDFAYAMQTRKRAIVVGETTRGGAHPMAPFRLSPYFLALIPVAETISPITHANWEGAGVRPDIAMPAANARSYAAARAAAQAALVR